MTEPRRMLLGGGGGDYYDHDADVVVMLGSARDDGPSEADRRAVGAALGFAFAASAATATTAATSASATTTAAAATGAASGSVSSIAALKVGAGKLGALALLKLGGGLALAFSIGVATGVRVQMARTPMAPIAAISPSAHVVIPSGNRLASVQDAPAELVAVEPSPPVPAAPSTTSAPTSLRAPQITPGPAEVVPATTAAPAASMLAQETLLLERARKSVARRAYVDAIAALDAYDVLAPSGVLVQEARALRVQAYADQGKRLAALDLGRAFLAEYPASPYAKRVKAIVDGLDAPSSP